MHALNSCFVLAKQANQICWLYLAMLCLSSLAFATGEGAPPVGRLPQSVQPSHYKIALQLDPKLDTFAGEVEITATLSQAQDFIWLHGNALDVSQVSVSATDGDLIGSYKQMDASGVALLQFPAALTPGELKIRLRYTARYSKKLDGLYKVMDGGKPYLFSQFESIFARQMFPGFDEPGFKTPFDVSLQIPSDMRAIFNTLEAKDGVKRDGNKQWIKFETTKKLPTYLLAVVVGELDIVEHAAIPASAIRTNTIPFRGVATAGKGKLMAYALENTAAIVAKLEEYFATPYPFEKLDIIAVPDFASGAMENAGAITYREQLLLMKPDAPMSQKVAYTSTHTHELAHQWFGNLVTPTWWDDIWLNEAFATWMAAKIAGKAQPTFNFQNRIQSGAIGAMDLDSFKSARQIRNEVNDKNEIIGAFDAITYSKGGGVLAMFESYLGATKFREGVRLYMRRHAYANANVNDFMRALSDASGDATIVPAFESFLTQNGVPKLKVALRCDKGNASLLIEQSRFQSFGAQKVDAQQWQIPMCMRFDDGKQIKSQCELLNAAKSIVTINSKRCPTWVLPNESGGGYFRVDLDPANWTSLLKNAKKLNSAEILALQDALAAGVFSGAISAELYLTRVAKIIETGSSDAIVASLATSRFVFDYLVQDTKSSAKRATALYARPVKILGLDANTELDKNAPAATAEQRLRVLEFVAHVGQDKPLRKALAARGSAFLGLDGQAARPSAVKPDLVELALAVTLQERGAPAVIALKAQLLGSSDAIFRAQALRALGWVIDARQADTLRNFSLDSSLRGNEVLLILRAQANQPATADTLWLWLQQNFDELLARLGEKTHYQVLDLVATRCDAVGEQSVLAFFTPKITSIINGPRALAIVSEKIARCRALRERDGK